MNIQVRFPLVRLHVATSSNEFVALKRITKQRKEENIHLLRLAHLEPFIDEFRMFGAMHSRPKNERKESVR